MALQLGKGGRYKSLQGMQGDDIAATTNLYVAYYFSSNVAGTLNPMSITTSLADLAGYEIQTPTTNGYARKRVDNLLGAPATHADGYAYVTNSSDIDCFTTSGALAQTVSASKQITHAIVTSQVTANTSSLDDIWWFGPVLGPLAAFATGDTMRVLAGKLQLRQS